MERQQNHYRRILDIANQNESEQLRYQVIPSWAKPLSKNGYRPQQDEETVFDSGIGKALFHNASKMNFFQFCHILEQISRQTSVPMSKVIRQPVRFRRVTRLSFPGSEIAGVEYPDEITPYPVVKTTFLGLYGVDAILPDYFLNDIATRKEGWESLAGFLDIFNHRVSVLFYQAWKKYRYAMVFLAGARDNISKALLSLTGVTRQNDQIPCGHLLGLLSIFYQRTKTADGLTCIVRHLLSGAAVTVVEFYPKWVSLDSEARLSIHNALALDGGSVPLGKRIRDSNHHVKMIIRPKTFRDAMSILPRRQNHRDLFMLLKIYLGYKLDADIFLELQKEWFTPPVLNPENSPILGMTTALGAQANTRRIKIGSVRFQAPGIGDQNVQ